MTKYILFALCFTAGLLTQAFVISPNFSTTDSPSTDSDTSIEGSAANPTADSVAHSAGDLNDSQAGVDTSVQNSLPKNQRGSGEANRESAPIDALRKQSAGCAIFEDKQKLVEHCSTVLTSIDLDKIRRAQSKQEHQYIHDNNMLWQSDIQNGVVRQDKNVIQEAIGEYEIEIRYEIHQMARRVRVEQKLKIFANDEGELQVSGSYVNYVNDERGGSGSGGGAAAQLGTETGLIHYVKYNSSMVEQVYVSRMGFKLPSTMQVGESQRLELLILPRGGEWRVDPNASVTVKRVQ